MKILHLSGSKYHWSGNEQQLSQLIEQSQYLGAENAIFCYEGSAIQAYAEKYNITCFAQPKKSIYNPFLAKALVRCVQDNGFDIIHVHTSNFLTVFVLAHAFLWLKIPAVFSRKGLIEKSSFFSRIKYNYKGIGGVICVSQAVKDNFQQFIAKKNRHKLRVIYDGIPSRAMQSLSREEIQQKWQLPQGKKIIGNIANHVPAKDLPTLIETLHQLVNHLGKTDIHLLQIGAKSTLTPFLEEKIKNYQLESYVTFTDKIPDAKRYLSVFDLFLFTSQWEGLPLVIYEAFQQKVPVVATRAGGIPEAVINQETGMLCPIGDALSLAKASERLLGDKHLRQKIVQDAYNTFSQRFTAEQNAQQTLNFYKEITQ